MCGLIRSNFTFNRIGRRKIKNDGKKRAWRPDGAYLFFVLLFYETENFVYCLMIYVRYVTCQINSLKHYSKKIIST